MSGPFAPGVESAVSDEISRLIKRYRLVFLHVVPPLVPVISALPGRRVPWHEVALEYEDPTEVILVEGLHEVLTRGSAASALGALRERAHALLDAGTPVCLLSNAPRIAFPTGPGSALLEDCYAAHIDSILATIAPDFVLWSDPIDHESFRNVLRDLGADMLSTLDFVFYELKQTREVPEAILSPLEWEALRGAGLFAIGDGSAFDSIPNPAVVMPLLDEVLVDVLEAQPSLGPVISGLHQIERRLRRALRRRAEAEFGSTWRGSVLSEQAAKDVLDRACADAYTKAPSVKALRDPFEWLTLGELLVLCLEAKWTDGLGMKAAYWRRFGVEVLPIRNRVGHMRLLRRKDEDTVRTWLVALSKL